MSGFDMKSLGNALKKKSATVFSQVESAINDVAGPKVLRNYEVGEQIASAGLSLMWRVYAGKQRISKKDAPSDLPPPDVAIWYLEKKWLEEKGRGKGDPEAYIDLCRKDVATMTKLRHPGVLRVIAPLDETRNAMAFVTEPILGSLANCLKRFDHIKKVPEALETLDMSPLEIKHGALQLLEGVAFLHSDANTVHRGITPESIVVTSGGNWKLSGFYFATALDFTDPKAAHPFYYPDFEAPKKPYYTQPSLHYVAPELVLDSSMTSTTTTPPPGPPGDMFSLACVLYEVTRLKTLLPPEANNIPAYKRAIEGLPYNSEAYSGLPPDFVTQLRLLTAREPNSRPVAQAFASSPFFRDDALLRALRFLDHMLERDTSQKIQFLNALPDMWSGLSPRILRYKVLPPLVSELRNPSMQASVLPHVLRAVDAQDQKEFMDVTMPGIRYLAATATGEALGELARSLPILAEKIPGEAADAVLVPALARCYEEGDPRVQEDALRKTPDVAQKLSLVALKEQILPRVHATALKTSVAAVRVHAFVCLGQLVPRMDDAMMNELLATMSRCVAVDKSASTLMCVLGVCDIIAKNEPVDMVAEKLLPILLPLTVAPKLNQQQFGTFMRLIKDMIKRIDDKRGAEFGESEQMREGARKSIAEAGGAKPNATGGKATTVQNGWDDWAPPPNAPSVETVALNKPLPPLPAVATAGLSSNSPMKPAMATTTTHISSSSDGFTWPPPSFSSSSSSLSSTPLPTTSFGTPVASAATPSWSSPSSFANNQSGTTTSYGQADDLDSMFKDPTWKDPALPHITPSMAPSPLPTPSSAFTSSSKPSPMGRPMPMGGTSSLGSFGAGPTQQQQQQHIGGVSNASPFNTPFNLDSLHSGIPPTQQQPRLPAKGMIPPPPPVGLGGGVQRPQRPGGAGFDLLS
eukprot:jgi/Chlat1/821/Chrsp104S01272